jgi:CubicO group peptidase (beta-lactamase class C family)
MTGGFSKAGLEGLEAAMAGFTDRGEVPGLVALVSRCGETHTIARGVRALGGAPVARDSLFRIASMTKPVTAAATMMLVDEGRIELDAPVERWLPELADRRVLRRLDGPIHDTVPANRSITARDLLTFTWGFGLVFQDIPIVRARDVLELGSGPPLPDLLPAPDEWIRRLGTLPLMRQPGEAWMYNTGSDVLGVLVARASGQAFETFLHERIFAPLGMVDTGFSVGPDRIDRLVDCYGFNSKTQAFDGVDPARGGQWSRPPKFPAGSAGLVSTADDFAAFGRMMLAKGEHGGHQLLSARAVELMTTNQLSPAQGASDPFILGDLGWGFGMAVTLAPDEMTSTPGRFGWDGGYGTSWHADPANGLTGVLLTQRLFDNPEGPAAVKAFWRSAYQALA